MRRWITFGGAGLLLLTLCAGAILLTGIAGWIFFPRPVEKSKPVRISILPPLATLVPSAEERPATVTDAADGAARAAAPVAPPPAAPQSAPAAAPVEPARVEEASGFALPPGTVNSITQAGVATRLVIPKLNLDAPIVLAPIRDNTWQVDQLGQAIGHLEGSAPAGSQSNFVLAGHVTLAETNGGPGPFFNLKNLAPGDLLIVYEGEKKFEYIADSFQTVDRTAVDVAFPTETSQITLITCSNWSKSEGRYVDRLVVKGHLVQE